MKKILLSFLCCMLAVIGMQAEEVTKSVTFSSYTAGTQYAQNEKHDLGDGLVIYTTECHFTSELRIYSSSTHNGYVVSDKLPGTITKMTFNMGNKTDVLNVYGSTDGKSWVLVNGISVTSTSYKDYSLDFTGAYTYFKLDVKGSNQVRIKKMSVTYVTGDTPVTPEPVKLAVPTFNPASGAAVAAGSVVTITAPDGATLVYTVNGGNEIKGENVATVTINEDTEIVAYATTTQEGYINSDPVTATYTLLPAGELVEATISFASTAQRVSQDSDSQVWSNEGITFTNNKASSTTPVADYSGPARMYAHSEIIIECSLGTITEIVFEANSEKDYATPLKNSIGNAATVSDKIVTVSDINASTFTIADLTAQVRLNSMTVTYVKVAEAVPVPTFSEPAGLVEQGTVVTITAPKDATLVYTVNDGDTIKGGNVEIITINEDTEIKAYATTTQEGYKDSDVVSAKYSIPVEGTWTLVTDANTLCNGDEVVIVAKDYDVALSKNAGNYRKQAAVKKEGNNVKFAQDVQVITLGEMDVVNDVPTWSMHTAEGYLFAPGTGNNENYLQTDTVNNAAWSIAIGDTVAGIIDMNNNAGEPNNVMRYNDNPTSLRFSCYKATNSQKDVVIYRNTPETLVYNVTVPAGTPACNIVGDFNGWTAFVPMTKVDDTHYTITIDNVTKSKKYKYTCGDDLKFVEMQADGVTDVVDRTWNENDVVEAWNAVPDFAETITARDYYFEPTVWATDEAWYAVYLCNRNIEENNYQWVQGYVTEKGLVVFTYGGKRKYTHMIFCRMNPRFLNKENFVGQMQWNTGDEADASEQHVWNQTNEETFDPKLGDWACFAITSMGQNGANSTGVWGVVQEPTAVDGVEATNGIAYANGVVTAEGAIEVYNVNGMVVARGNESLDLRNLNAGVYIVRNGNNVRKVVR